MKDSGLSVLIQEKEKATEEIQQCGLYKSEIDQIADFDLISHRRRSFSVGKLFKKRTKE